MEILEKDQFVGDIRKAHFYSRSEVLWTYPGRGDQATGTRKVNGHREVGIAKNHF